MERTSAGERTGSLGDVAFHVHVHASIFTSLLYGFLPGPKLLTVLVK